MNSLQRMAVITGLRSASQQDFEALLVELAPHLRPDQLKLVLQVANTEIVRRQSKAGAVLHPSPAAWGL